MSNIDDFVPDESTADGEYVPAPEGYPVHQPGRDVVLTLDAVKAESTKAGHYKANVDFLNESGIPIRFQTFSAKKYYRGPRGVQLTQAQREAMPKNTSQIFDLAKAFGFPGSLRDFPTAPREIHAYLEAQIGATLKADIDWRGWCKGCQEETIRHASGFPGDKSGRGEVASCPKCGDPIKARVFLSRVY